VQAHVVNLGDVKNNIMTQKLRELKNEDSSIKLKEALLAKNCKPLL
jgi:hypothetical protein